MPHWLENAANAASEFALTLISPTFSAGAVTWIWEIRNPTGFHSNMSACPSSAIGVASWIMTRGTANYGLIAVKLWTRKNNNTAHGYGPPWLTYSHRKLSKPKQQNLLHHRDPTEPHHPPSCNHHHQWQRICTHNRNRSTP